MTNNEAEALTMALLSNLNAFFKAQGVAAKFLCLVNVGDDATAASNMTHREAVEFALDYVADEEQMAQLILDEATPPESKPH